MDNIGIVFARESSAEHEMLKEVEHAPVFGICRSKKERQFQRLARRKKHLHMPRTAHASNS